MNKKEQRTKTNIDWRSDHMLHLHCLHNHNGIPLFHWFPFLLVHLDHLSRHWRRQSSYTVNPSNAYWMILDSKYLKKSRLMKRKRKRGEEESRNGGILVSRYLPSSHLSNHPLPQLRNKLLSQPSSPHYHYGWSQSQTYEERGRRNGRWKRYLMELRSQIHLNWKRLNIPPHPTLSSYLSNH